MEKPETTPNKHVSDGIKKLINGRQVAIAGLVVLISVISLAAFSSIHIGQYKQYILDADNPGKRTQVGIVFGAGVAPNGRPYQELEARLDAAARALENGTIQKILLSGDNRVLNYNEPDAMITYLVEEKGIARQKLQPDYAGRSTYETCERAKKIFGQNRVILFSATSHLPRAIFTCRSFGIESFGIGNSTEANNATRREVLARTKALFNIYIYGEETILGEPIEL